MTTTHKPNESVMDARNVTRELFVPSSHSKSYELPSFRECMEEIYAAGYIPTLAADALAHHTGLSKWQIYNCDIFPHQNGKVPGWLVIYTVSHEQIAKESTRARLRYQLRRERMGA